MKPIRLQMNAFGPFAKIATVEFKELEQDGLFLISGDTGSGKTTIFDAISFALFDTPSGTTRTAASLRSDFASHEDETYVALWFLHRGKEYYVKRNPEYIRPKKRGKGTTKTSAYALLQMPGDNIIEGSTAVSERITEILGIDWKQFKQLVMLAQGEFLSILTADSKTRGEIFRKIFGTVNYAQIGWLLKEKSNQLSAACEKDKQRILQYLEGVDYKGTIELQKFFEVWKEYTDFYQIQELISLIGQQITVDEHNISNKKEENLLCTERLTLLSAQMEKMRTLVNAYKENHDKWVQMQHRIVVKEKEVNEADTKEKEAVRLFHKNSIWKEQSNEILISITRKQELLHQKNIGLQQILNMVQKIRQSEILLEQKQCSYVEQNKEYSKLYAEYYEKEYWYYQAQAGILADALRENEPCPVCGSIKHPKPAVKREDAPNQKELEILKKKTETSHAAMIETSLNCHKMQAAIEEMENNLYRQLAELGREKTNLAHSDLSKYISVMEQEERTLIHSIESEIEQEQKRYDLKNKEYEKQREMLEYWSKRTGILAAELEQLTEREKECMIQHNKLSDELFGLAGAAAESLEESFQTQFVFMQEKLDQEKGMKSELERQIRELERRITVNRNITIQVKKAIQSYHHFERKWQDYYVLSKTANGEQNQKNKLAFEQYVQAYYFEQVIEEANKRLYSMSNSKYALMRKDTATDKRSRSGLELEVMDYYTGKKRSVKSLSGGESFQAALALALGLSDFMQRFTGGVEIEALFIDEGFGSLDSNALEQAIETLYTLTEGNCMVGIISHVNELKERIPQQLTVEKTIYGSYVKQFT